MKYIIMMAMVCITATACNRSAMPSSTPIINAEVKNEQGKTILAGHCSLSILETDPYKVWFTKSYSPYVVDTSLIPSLHTLLQDKTIEIFLGSWCGDSKREVPRVIKILQAASFDTSRIKLIFVDNSTARYKQSPQHEEAGKFIHHVPDIIFFQNNKELGRIVEEPMVSLEKDMISILTKQPYTPSYQALAYWHKHVKRQNSSFADDRLKSIAAKVKPCCKSMYEFNAYGYVLLAQKNYTAALNVFKLNTILFPAEAGTYDSLGEAYADAGNKEEARKNYVKVLQLKPGDENATNMLKQLK